MTYVEQITQTKSPQDALLVLAAALDEIRVLVTTTPDAPADEWGSWGSAPAPIAAASPPPPVAGGPAPEYTPIEIPVDHAEVARLEAAYAQADQALEAARRAGQPREALAELHQRAEGIRGRLDLARNPGSILPVSGDMVGDPMSILHVDVTPTDVTIDLPPATPEQKQKRRELAEALDLPGFFPTVARQTPEARDELIEAYVKGGPFWIYLDNRDLIMQMPMWARQAMVHDVDQLGDTRLAHEFARDVMKTEDEGNIDLARDFIASVSDAGGVPFKGAGEG